MQLAKPYPKKRVQELLSDFNKARNQDATMFNQSGVIANILNGLVNQGLTDEEYDSVLIPKLEVEQLSDREIEAAS